MSLDTIEAREGGAQRLTERSGFTGIVYNGAEMRITDPRTGGAKGSKLARFDMIPPDVLWELAEHYGKGEAKYPSDPHPNWERGYDWRLSSAALDRHWTAWKMGEDTDAETGDSHLIAVLWHAMALRWFQLHHKGTDYRTRPTLRPQAHGDETL